MFLVDTKTSAQNLIAKDNPPRVQISYEVYTKGATLSVQLPFVAGVMADLAGATHRKIAYSDRDFIQLDNDSFEQFMDRIAPSVKVVWTDANGDDAGDTLGFATMDDFGPSAIAERAEGIARHYSARRALMGLMARLDGNAAFQQTVMSILQPAASDGTAETDPAKINAAITAMLTEVLQQRATYAAEVNGDGDAPALPPPA